MTRLGCHVFLSIRTIFAVFLVQRLWEAGWAFSGAGIREMRTIRSNGGREKVCAIFLRKAAKQSDSIVGEI